MYPPVTSTFPEGNKVAVWARRTERTGEVGIHFGQLAVTLKFVEEDRPSALVTVAVMMTVVSFGDEEPQTGADQTTSLRMAVLVGVPRLPALELHAKLSTLFCGSRVVR